MTAREFVSYRRDDSKHAAGRSAERLDERFTLFRDVDRIRPGVDRGGPRGGRADGCDAGGDRFSWLTLMAANGGAESISRGTGDRRGRHRSAARHPGDPGAPEPSAALDLEAAAAAAEQSGRWEDAVYALEAIVALQPSDEVTERLAQDRLKVRVSELPRRQQLDANDWAGAEPTSPRVPGRTRNRL